jgi:hypothetical protein
VISGTSPLKIISCYAYQCRQADSAQILPSGGFICKFCRQACSFVDFAISLQNIYNNISALDSSVDPPVAAASSAAGSPAVEKGDWRGNNHSRKPCLHILPLKAEIHGFPGAKFVD